MFAVICFNETGNSEPIYITLTLEPVRGDFLGSSTRTFSPDTIGIRAAGIRVKSQGAVPEERLRAMLDPSRLLVLS